MNTIDRKLYFAPHTLINEENSTFFENRPAQENAWTKKMWVYDLRTNMHFTLKTNPLKRADLDIFWLRDETLEESDNLPDPEILAQEIVDDLQTALEQFANIAAELRE